MKRVLAFVLLTMFAATIGGCSKKTCETIADECDWTSGLEDACIEDYKDGGNCRDSLKEYRDCVEEDGCDLYYNGCDDEALDVLDDCNEIVDYIEF